MIDLRRAVYPRRLSDRHRGPDRRDGGAGARDLPARLVLSRARRVRGGGLPHNGRVPRLPASAPPTRHTADPARTRAELATLRPDLLGRYDAELPGARAAILGRLLGALAREPLPGLVTRQPLPAAVTREPLPAAVTGSARLAVGFAGGTTVEFPAAPAALFAAAEAGLIAQVRPAGAPASPPGPPAEAANVDDPGALARLLWPGTALVREIDNSVANLALARAARPKRQLPSAGEPGTLAALEQLVTDGHPLHPCCRTRGGMSVADVLAYAPEHAPVIRLRRLRVPPDRWYGTAAPDPATPTRGRPTVSASATRGWPTTARPARPGR